MAASPCFVVIPEPALTGTTGLSPPGTNVGTATGAEEVTKVAYPCDSKLDEETA